MVYYVGRLAQLVEAFDRKTSEYMERQKLRIKEQLKRSSQAGKADLPPSTTSAQK